MNKWNKIKNLEYTKNMKFNHNLIKNSLNLFWCDLNCTLNTYKNYLQLGLQRLLMINLTPWF
jgi:hypothetical protein